MHRVRGIVQHYPWGDTTALPSMLGLPGDGRPWAEIWFGTHPGGPATVAPLDRSQLTAETSLGAVAGRLPYMLKLLSAASPLSLQAHPSREQAVDGFAREEGAGIPLGSPARVYGDPLAKPEFLVALSPFKALCGVRPPALTEGMLRDIGGGAAKLADRLAAQGVSATIADFLVDRRPTLAIVEACRRSDLPEAKLVLDLERMYPADPAVVVTLLLNLVSMRAGQAIYLTPGNLHAYLKGTAIEVMGASDNVVRAGLTHKKTAIEELMAIHDPNPLRSPLSPIEKVTQSLWRYATPGAPFGVYAQHVAGPTEITAMARELVICGVGSTDVLHSGEVIYLDEGETLTMDGTATVFRVAEA